eukprot:TRINITY_DN11939_c1_g1_i3.p1 TRINITY_DN11939_c1_g1~~TRINITY_DN11939_c1_g1_i3.p1  ORF type:complete len:379 (+),score=64.50 TRINITY_DN11939_c1_g1_i3:46-1182(+)
MAREILYHIVSIVVAVAISVSITLPVSHYVLDDNDDSSASASSGSAPSSSETATAFSSFTEPRPAYTVLGDRGFYASYIGATLFLTTTETEIKVGSTFRDELTHGNNFYPHAVRAPGFDSGEDDDFPTVDGSNRVDRDAVMPQYEPLRDGGFLVKSSPRLLQLEEDEVVYRNVSVWSHLVLRDGCLRKDTYIQAFEATELGEVELEVFDPYSSKFNFLTKSIWEAKGVDSFLNLTDDQSPSLLNPLSDRQNVIAAHADVENFGIEGDLQVVVASKAQASTLRWVDNSGELRTIFANVSLAQGETAVFTTFAIFDQTTSHVSDDPACIFARTWSWQAISSLQGLLERGFDVWDSLDTIQSNFPQLVMGLPEDRAMIRNW